MKSQFSTVENSFSKDATSGVRLPLHGRLPEFDRSVSLVCWAYNEEDLIGSFLERADKLLKTNVKDYEIVIVDDGSTDKTRDIITDFMKQAPRVRLVRNETNLDIGHAGQKAIMNATKDYLFWQTIDWSYDLTNLRAFLELLKDYDVVAGVRRAPVLKADQIYKRVRSFLNVFGIKHITSRSDNIPKAIVSLINYFLVRFLFRVPISDYQNIVFYPRKLIQSIQHESKSAFSNGEGLFKAYWGGATIKEVPISFVPRSAGKAKGTRVKSILCAIRDIFKLWFRWNVLGKKTAGKKGKILRLNTREWEHETYARRSMFG